MLLQCPECNLQVSDKAEACPHCGYPMVTKDKQKRHPRQTRRRRLPNGFGQISEIKGRNLRKPFRAMVTVGKTDAGRPICKLLEPQAYFETYNDAYTALVEYNRSPYDLEKDITLSELHGKWSEEHYNSGITESTVRGLRCMWRHLSPLYGIKVSEIRARHLKAVLDSTEIPSPSKPRVKVLLNMLLDYAVEYELIDHNYAKDFSLPREVSKDINAKKKSHITFTEEEMQILWANLHNPKYSQISMILIQCYAGWRPVELCNLKKSDIDLQNRSMTGGCKTDAGINRVVPIHPRILPLVQEAFANEKGGRLFGNITYGQYRYYFKRIINDLGLSNRHNPHDCRVYFVTEAKRHGVDEYALKIIVGHAISDITEAVYTKRDLEWLRSEIEKIK